MQIEEALFSVQGSTKYVSTQCCIKQSKSLSNYMEYFKKRDLVIEKWSNPYRTLKFVQMKVVVSRSKLNFDNATGL